MKRSNSGSQNDDNPKRRKRAHRNASIDCKYNIEYGEWNEKQNRYDEARRDYTKAIEYDPSYAKAYVNRGKLLKNHFKRYDDALRDYVKAIECDPSYATAYYNHALLLATHFKRYDDALSDYAKAIERDPSYASAYNNRALLLKNHFKRYDDALRDYAKAIECDPSYATAYYNRALLLKNHFKRYDDALHDYAKAIECDPSFATAYYNRAVLLATHFKLYDDALRDYAKAIECDPSDASAYNNRAFLLEDHFKRYDDALRDYAKAIECNNDPSNEASLINLDHLIRLIKDPDRRKRFENAASHCEKLAMFLNHDECEKEQQDHGQSSIVVKKEVDNGKYIAFHGIMEEPFASLACTPEGPGELADLEHEYYGRSSEFLNKLIGGKTIKITRKYKLWSSKIQERMRMFKSRDRSQYLVAMCWMKAMDDPLFVLKYPKSKPPYQLSRDKPFGDGIVPDRVDLTSSPVTVDLTQMQDETPIPSLSAVNVKKEKKES